jgi:hypothetical protein
MKPQSNGVLGHFHQANFHDRGDEYESHTFTGIQLQAPLFITEKISLFASFRAGKINQLFLIAVPALETRVRLSRTTAITVGTGLRMNYPSLSAKLSVKLF